MGVVRKIIAKAININSWFWIIALSFLILAIYMATTPAFAVERSDIDSNKNEIKTLEDNNITLKENAQTKRDEIVEQEDIISTLKDTLREVKRLAGDSWDAVLDIRGAEDNLNDGIDSMNSMRNELLSILNEQSDNTRKILQLKDQISNDERSIKTKVILDDLTKLIGVDISKSCETMLKNNFTSSCVGYDLLRQLDSSNESISGGWIVEDGYTKRDVSVLEKSWRWYDTDDNIRIIVDPPTGMTERIKMITLTNNFDTYFTPSDMKLENNTRTWHEGRYVDKCRTAIIDVNNWLMLLPDTIHYLRTNCEVTGYDELKSENMTLSNIDITTSPNYQAELKLIADKERCKVKC